MDVVGNRKGLGIGDSDVKGAKGWGPGDSLCGKSYPRSNSKELYPGEWAECLEPMSETGSECNHAGNLRTVRAAKSCV